MHDFTIGELAPFKYGKGLPRSNRAAGSVPVYGSSGIVGYHNEPLTTGPTVIVGRKGTVGAVYFSAVPCWPIDTTFFVEFTDADKARFIYYVLRNTGLDEMNSDSAVPGLSRDAAHAYVVSLPSEDSWPVIASVLGTLDDKIDQNRRTADLLERLAEAIFFAWFVDFEPVKARAAGATSFPSVPQHAFDALPTRFADSEIGPVPDGWETRPISTVATFLNGLALQKYPTRLDGNDLAVIKIAQLRRGTTEGADRANDDVPHGYIVDDSDLLFSWSGTLEARFWFGGAGALNQHLFKVTSEDYPSWFCLLWIRRHLPWFRAIAAGKATTMGHIKRGDLDEAQVVTPTNNVLREADQVIGSLYEHHGQVLIESRKLAEVRDLLLPKLLAGDTSAKIPNG